MDHPSVTPIVATTWDGVIRELMTLRDAGFFSFRGQRKHDWPLGLHHPDEVSETDLQQGLAQFRKRCMEFPKPEYLRETNHWRWLFFAQHFRLRTRLLDWTTNPLVALYFAVENILTEKSIRDENPSGVVWALRVRDEDFRSEDELPRVPKDQERWIMINPPPVTSRITRQSAKFSFHPEHDCGALNQIPRRDPDNECEQLVKVQIGDPGTDNSRLTDEIREKLGVMNVHHGSLFPDPEGVALFINDQWPAIRTQAPWAERHPE